ncbi:outer membrane beta-barrel protein [Bergeyella sp. RCAD1439]|uniref:outer membrane beta-barrel protein n=1 Tax=Bergeyella anatis TaxID=3113737 RepID=UPI002E17DD7A|nr:outer membrane beta-barrel protein [Bergeyella sp. RCAD1439]
MKKQIITGAAICLSIVGFSQEVKTDSTAKVKEIQEVIIKSQRKKQFSDKSVYTFDKEAIAAARHSKDLLVSLPEVQLDLVSNRMSSVKGGKILFLINGIEATDMQFGAVAPENVVRVEYFDIVPTRWEGKADVVVNMITRNPENGLTYGAEAIGAFSTGFLDAQVYASHTRGNHDFGLEYAFSLRDYDNREYLNSYEYSLNGTRYKSEEKRRDHFGYTIQDVALRYTYAKPEKETFQAKFNLNLMNDFSKGNGRSIFEQGKVSSLNNTKDYKSGKYLKPTLDLYYSRQIGKKDELVVNFIGSVYDNQTYQNDREWVASTGVDLFNNEMSLIAKQKAFVGEVAHYHNLGKAKWNSGYRISNNTISNDLTNLSGQRQFSVNYLEQYFYSEISGRKEKFMYRFGAGLTNIHNKSAESVFDEWTFTPRLLVGYTFKNNQSLRFTSSYKPSSPSSSQLSPNVVNIAPNIIRRGNPFLKSQKSWTNSLIYSINSKYFDFNTTLGYIHIDRMANSYYVLDQDFGGYALTYQNADFYQSYRWEFSGSIKPFGNRTLVIKTYLRPTSEMIKLEDGRKLKNTYLKNYFNITSQYKKWFLQYQFNIPTYFMGGAFLFTEENKSHLAMGYTLGNWVLKGGMYWMGMPSEYKTKSQKESLVNFTGNTQILNNKNMIFLGVSYNFTRGKNVEIDKKLENETAEAARF